MNPEARQYLLRRLSEFPNKARARKWIRDEWASDAREELATNPTFRQAVADIMKEQPE